MYTHHVLGEQCLVLYAQSSKHLYWHRTYKEKDIITRIFYFSISNNKMAQWRLVPRLGKSQVERDKTRALNHADIVLHNYWARRRHSLFSTTFNPELSEIVVMLYLARCTNKKRMPVLAAPWFMCVVNL